MLDYTLYEYYFERRGWKRFRLFMTGMRWTSPEKPSDAAHHEVTLSAGGFRLNGKPVEEQTIIDMLQIPEREVMMYEELRRLGHRSQWALAFLDGVRWADAHPAK